MAISITYPVKLQKEKNITKSSSNDLESEINATELKTFQKIVSSIPNKFYEELFKYSLKSNYNLLKFDEFSYAIKKTKDSYDVIEEAIKKKKDIVENKEFYRNLPEELKRNAYKRTYFAMVYAFSEAYNQHHQK